jgi:hypothetical protein
VTPAGGEVGIGELANGLEGHDSIIRGAGGSASAMAWRDGRTSCEL